MKQVGQKACATSAGAGDQKTRGWAKSEMVTAGVQDVCVLPNAWHLSGLKHVQTIVEVTEAGFSCGVQPRISGNQLVCGITFPYEIDGVTILLDVQLWSDPNSSGLAMKTKKNVTSMRIDFLTD